MKIINIYGDNRFPEHTKTREACRGIVIKDGDVLLSYEPEGDIFMIPGGGVEPGEKYEDCCIRELAEETGLVVKPLCHFLTINEYYEEYLYPSHYFLCEAVGKTERQLTEREKRAGLEPRLIPLTEAISIFSKHQDFADNEMKRGIYLREYKALIEAQLFLEQESNTSTNTHEEDDSQRRNAINPEVSLIIEKWYKKLCFPKRFDEEFYEALNTTHIPDSVSIESYDKSSTDGKRNLLTYLFLCERAAEKCAEMGIPESIVLATLSDIVIWCENWSEIKGELYLGELIWLSRHLESKLFRLGRLQFCAAASKADIPKYNIKEGDPIIEIHIPRGESLTKELCQKSISEARKFYAEHFPNFEYKAFTCHSWLLDDTLSEFLPENSGIMSFGNMFDRVRYDESYNLIRFIFTWDTTMQNLESRRPTSSLSAKVQNAALRGRKFYEVLGVIEK